MQIAICCWYPWGDPLGLLVMLAACSCSCSCNSSMIYGPCLPLTSVAATKILPILVYTTKYVEYTLRLLHFVAAEHNLWLLQKQPTARNEQNSSKSALKPKSVRSAAAAHRSSKLLFQTSSIYPCPTGMATAIPGFSL